MGNVTSKYRHPKESAWIENYPFSDEPPNLDGCFVCRGEEERETDHESDQGNNSKL